jgi:hypothetical protein
MATEEETPPTTTTSGSLQLSNPPRLANDPAIDGPANSQWLNEMFRYLQRQAQTIGALSGTDPGQTDPNELPDPASTNLATAQQTANDAYTLAASARALAQKYRKGGSVTISDANTTGALTLTPAEADASYLVVVTPVAKSGAPAAASKNVDTVTKAVGSVTINIEAAPGVGTSRTFDVLVFRA